MFKIFKVVLDGNYIYAVDDIPIKTKSGEEIFRIKGHLPLNGAPSIEELFLMSDLPGIRVDDYKEANMEIPKYYKCIDFSISYSVGVYSDELDEIDKIPKAIKVATNSIYGSL